MNHQALARANDVVRLVVALMCVMFTIVFLFSLHWDHVVSLVCTAIGVIYAGIINTESEFHGTPEAKPSWAGRVSIVATLLFSVFWLWYGSSYHGSFGVITNLLGSWVVSVDLFLVWRNNANRRVLKGTGS